MNAIAHCCWFVSLLWAAVVARAEDMSFTVDDPRPLSVVLDRASTRLGYAITYEDPRYAYAGDLKDITAEVRPEGPAEPKIFRPLGGTFELRGVPIPRVMNLAAASEVVERILAVQQASPVGGRFKVIRAGNLLHVVPKSVRNERGAWIDQTSLLDARITIPKKRHSIWSMAQAICKEVGRANGVPVVFNAPASIIMPEPTSLALGEVDDPNEVNGADNEVAREVLMRSIALSGYRMTWKLTYFPGPTAKAYFLSLVQLPDAAPALPATKSGSSSDTPPVFVPGYGLRKCVGRDLDCRITPDGKFERADRILRRLG